MQLKKKKHECSVIDSRFSYSGTRIDTGIFQCGIQCEVIAAQIRIIPTRRWIQRSRLQVTSSLKIKINVGHGGGFKGAVCDSEDMWLIMLIDYFRIPRSSHSDALIGC